MGFALLFLTSHIVEEGGGTSGRRACGSAHARAAEKIPGVEEKPLGTRLHSRGGQRSE